ncbi:MAG TPA: Uma2 family endonuclease [Verrucomicrobiota bacterium]|nr:Uma2 family endonuclease [Verrucomicrobiales bacterium]HRI12969.1 Uma2 family endonuclease [Verrucomicrobiota bacterium]
MSRTILEPLLKSPELIEHVEELQRVIARERQQRLKFYEEIGEDGKWEFINGEAVMQSPAVNRHAAIVGRLLPLLRAWIEPRGLGQVRAEKILCQFPRNDYEPDLVFFGPEKSQTITPQTLLHPIPDFVVEVLSPSTATIDRGVKFEDYAAHGVGEYWLVDTEAETVEQFLLRDGRYGAPVEQSHDGILRSSVIAGFELPVRALFDDEANLAALRQLLR